MNLNRTVIEKILKKAIQRGDLHLEFSDDDIDYLLTHSVPTKSGRPSKGLLGQLEQILLKASYTRSTEPIAELESLETVVKERAAPYGKSTAVGGVDVGSCSVGDALHKELQATGRTAKQAAEKLGISERIIESLLKEPMTVTRSKARRVVGLLSGQYRLSGGAQELLGQWLLNGLSYWKLRHESGKTGLLRAAARKRRK